MVKFLQITISRKTVRALLVALLALFLVALAGTFFKIDYLSRVLPSLDALQTIEPSVKTIIFAANGDTLREFYT